MAEWQPIETAPKDGSEIILGIAGASSIDFFRWNTDCNEWLDRTADPPHGPPTHWMPKPEPPNA